MRGGGNSKAEWSVVRFEDWAGWWRKQYDHDQIGNGLGGEAGGWHGGNAKELPQVLAQLLASGGKTKADGLRGVIVKAGVGKAALYQRVAQALKAVFHRIGWHRGTKKAGVGAAGQANCACEKEAA